jgi:hypothetical protein
MFIYSICMKCHCKAIPHYHVTTRLLLCSDISYHMTIKHIKNTRTLTDRYGLDGDLSTYGLDPSTCSLDGDPSTYGLDGDHPSTYGLDGDPSTYGLDGDPSTYGLDGDP